MTVQVLFRDEIVDVEIDGVFIEPDINFQCVEWHFSDPSLRDIEVTDAEEASILEALWDSRLW